MWDSSMVRTIGSPRSRLDITALTLAILLSHMSLFKVCLLFCLESFPTSLQFLLQHKSDCTSTMFSYFAYILIKCGIIVHSQQKHLNVQFAHHYRLESNVGRVFILLLILCYTSPQLLCVTCYASGSGDVGSLCKNTHQGGSLPGLFGSVETIKASIMKVF